MTPSELAAATRTMRLREGECLPGRVWRAGEPINLPNVDRQASFSRCDAAARAGLHSAVAVPAIHNDEVFAVIELLSREPGRLSRRLMLSLRAIGSELGQFLAHRPGDLHPISLTARQLEVLQLAAHGLTGREIAGQLFISASTVKSHFENIYSKFERLRSRVSGRRGDEARPDPVAPSHQISPHRGVVHTVNAADTGSSVSTDTPSPQGS